MHTGFFMLPEMIKSPSYDLVVIEDKKLPMVVENSCTSLVKI